MPRKTPTRNPSSAWAKLLGRIPGYDPFRDAAGFHFEPEAAQHAIDFFETILVHVKGRLAGKPFILQPWQKAIVANLFGWKRADGTRRYRTGFLFVPRKNGKSTLAFGFLLYGLYCDGELGAEIYCAAADTEQARLVFEPAKYQVRNNPVLLEHAQVFRDSIVIQSTASFIRVLSKAPGTKHGFNPHLVVADELHAHPSGELVEVLETGTGAREQPLFIYITTSDYERPSVCNVKHDYATKVRDGILSDPTFLPVLYEASRDDDWTDPKIWRKANPNLGISIRREYLKRKCKEAQDVPTAENAFKRLHLNIRTEQEIRYLQMARWDACSGETDPESLKGRLCYAGLDLASTRDVNAFVLLFPPTDEDPRFHVLPYFWVPRDGAELREKRDRVPYLTWANAGFLELTSGDTTDYQLIGKRILELSRDYNLRSVAYDPWNAEALANALSDQGLEVVKFPQGVGHMNAPTKRLETLVLSARLAHAGHPVLRWMASNVTVEERDANIRPSRKKSSEKIDGIVALIMAIGLHLEEREPETVYSTRGLLQL